MAQTNKQTTASVLLELAGQFAVTPTYLRGPGGLPPHQGLSLQFYALSSAVPPFSLQPPFFGG